MLKILSYVAIILFWLVFFHVYGNRIMNALLHWLSGYLRCRLIYESGTGHLHPYLERYYIGTIPFTDRHVYLHRFLDDDPAGLHDHPWRWAVSFLICGQYMETRRWGKRVKRWFNYLSGESFHRLEVIRGVYTWSIFIAGPRVKTWGMMQTLEEYMFKRDSHALLHTPLDEAFIWERYNYGGIGKNENAWKADWTKTYPYGRFAKRERRDYAVSK